MSSISAPPLTSDGRQVTREEETGKCVNGEVGGWGEREKGRDWKLGIEDVRKEKRFVTKLRRGEEERRRGEEMRR